MTSTVESSSMAVPAAEQPAEPAPEQQEQELGATPETERRSDVVKSGRPHRILVASLGTGMGTTTIAALLGMLNSCATGVAVVNIDNGFGAAAIASSINHLP